MLLGCLVLAAGCERGAPPQFVPSTAAIELDPPLQEAVRKELQERCGTPLDPKLLGSNEKDAEHLRHGARVYERNCVQCHGVSGDGNGPAAGYLTPRPRDYRRGIFKFTSTPYGSKPRREDLLRTVTRGITGTSMPSFRRMPKRDLESVVDYVLALTHRGELEVLLADHAENEGELDDAAADELAAVVLKRWEQAGGEMVEPATKMPPLTPESVAAGAAAFQKRECFKCHGRDGRGGLAGGIEVGTDAWGHKAAAADLTSGMLHGGQKPLDIYRRIHAGINGTPMPTFKDVFAAEPDTIWNLTHYVLHLADQRRRGIQFALGPATPAGEVLPAGDSQAQPSSSEPGEPATQPAGESSPKESR
jgi:mono/diheme cytochrome c family protein